MIRERLGIIHILIKFWILKLLTCVQYLPWMNLRLVGVINTILNLLIPDMPLRVIIEVFWWQFLDIGWLVHLIVDLVGWELSCVKELHLVVNLREYRHTLLNLRCFWVMILIFLKTQWGLLPFYSLEYLLVFSIDFNLRNALLVAWVATKSTVIPVFLKHASF
jgi:hypothetical protein